MGVDFGVFGVLGVSGVVGFSGVVGAVVGVFIPFCLALVLLGVVGAFKGFGTGLLFGLDFQ